MNILVAISSFLILLVVLRGNEVLKTRDNVQEEQETSQITPSPEPTTTPEPTSMPTSKPLPVQINIVQPTPQPNPGVENTTNNYQYPNSTLVSEAGGKKTYQSSDNAKVITDWYKNKISSDDMNVKSFVQTNTNGQILNKLVASGSTGKVDVEIRRGSGETITNITVSLS